jgi:hypothetical protein
MIVAHEFFDALPICMVEVRTLSLLAFAESAEQRRTEGWREVLVDEVAATGIVSSTCVLVMWPTRLISAPDRTQN